MCGDYQANVFVGNYIVGTTFAEAQRPNHIWAYDFVFARTHDGRSVRLLTVIDECKRRSKHGPVGRDLALTVGA